MISLVSKLLAGKAAASAVSRVVDSGMQRFDAKRAPKRSFRGRSKGSARSLKGLLFGAGAMYFLDPEAGSERRRSFATKVREMVDNSGARDKASDLRSRAKGGAGAVIERMPTSKTSSTDDVVSAVQDSLADVSEEAAALTVELDAGRVVVSGPLGRPDVDAVRSAIAGVPGAAQYEDRIEILEEQSS